jgi:hypothetical protein
VKYGAGLGLSIVGSDVGVVFVGFKAPEGTAVGLTLDRTIFLRDVGEALRQSSAVAEIAIEQIATPDARV